MSRSILATLLLLAGLVPSRPVAAQTVSNDWTERPDARAPGSVREDVILAPGSFEARYTMRLLSFDGLKTGTTEILPITVLSLWDLVPLSMTTQRHEVELLMGIRDWLGASIVVPFHHRSTELVNDQFGGITSTTGVGDVEAHALIGLHDAWPYRAHLIAGVSLPTGSVDKTGLFPDAGAGAPEATLPYPLQPGDGTVALIPGVVVVTENDFGTVGLQVKSRIPLGENDRGWTRGNTHSGNLWMAYRFTDWVSGSVRVRYSKIGNVTGSDLSVDEFKSPLGHPLTQGGTRWALPLGINLRFVEGRLEGRRVSIEAIIPVHQDLDGPQLVPDAGFALTWGVAF